MFFDKRDLSFMPRTAITSKFNSVQFENLMTSHAVFQPENFT